MRRTLRLLVLLLAVAAIGVVIGRSVAPPARPLTRAEVDRVAGLDRVVADVHFRQTPFEEAVEFLRTTTGVNVTVNWNAIEAAGADRNTPITLRIANLPLKRVLELVCDEAGGSTIEMDTRELDGAVIISTREDNARYAAVRLYDVQDLIRTHHDFRVELGWRPPPPPTNRSGGGGGNSLFAGNFPPDPYDEAVETLVGLIIEHVEPDMWRDAGGTVGSMREINGRLLITATPQMHEEIAALLELIRKGE